MLRRERLSPRWSVAQDNALPCGTPTFHVRFLKTGFLISPCGAGIKATTSSTIRSFRSGCTTVPAPLPHSPIRQSCQRVISARTRSSAGQKLLPRFCAAKYCMIAPDSYKKKSPSCSAGSLPLGSIFKNADCLCSPPGRLTSCRSRAMLDSYDTARTAVALDELRMKVKFHKDLLSFVARYAQYINDNVKSNISCWAQRRGALKFVCARERESDARDCDLNRPRSPGESPA